MKDALGDRMKSGYEDRTRISLPRRSYTIIRIDGKAFHTYTKGLNRPFDSGLMDDMDATAAYLCKNIMGAKFAYVQSDEISLVLTDFDELGTHAWFDNNLQKMASVAASMATARFNELRTMRMIKEKCNKTDWSKVTNETLMMNLTTCFKLAMFDARVFQIPQKVEVENYFIWRQQDATRNSISSVAQSMYSPKELHGVKTDGMQELIFQKGINWNDYTPREKRGGIIRKIEKRYLRKGSNAEMLDSDTIVVNEEDIFTRGSWELDVETPIFTQTREYLNELIPVNR
jgi:tRNA(His) 5'-end guanylyltransferase